MTAYITDSVNLYEILVRIQNYGLAGGEYLFVANVRTDERRPMSALEASLCEAVGS